MSRKIKQLEIKKWRLAYLTRDLNIEELRLAEEKSLADQKKYDSETKSLVQFDVFFSSKMLEKLPADIKNIMPKYPRKIILRDVYYRVDGKKIFINFFTTAQMEER